MKKALYLKFVFTYLIFGFLSFFTIATLTSTLTKNYLIKAKATALDKECRAIASSKMAQYYQDEETGDLVKLYSNLSVLATYQSSQIWVVDSRGNVLLNTSEALSTGSTKQIEGFNPSRSGNKIYEIGTFYDSFTTDMMTVISPISSTSSYKAKGYIVIHHSIKDIIGQRDALLNISYITLGAIFLLSLIILGAFTVWVYIPLQKITFAANEYASGNLNYELPVNTGDEMGYLAATLNYMSSELNESEEYQKKFISNVSHDFRSPLTSIKGYVEAILDGTITHDMQDKYLEIVIFETERLNKLTSGLLDLNDYDSKKRRLDISKFDINSIIKKTSLTFEGTCRNKKISIELILTGQMLYVMGDVGKIQQVIYNLIDNAIKFSHNDSIIYVETTQKHEKVFISVKDTGIGIPKDSMKKIWERFYKTDLSRGKDKKGTGLGLAITREIIQAHNENINVISTEGVGTEFIFTLPRAKDKDAAQDNS